MSTKLVPPEDAGLRLDKWLGENMAGYSRSLAQKEIEKGSVKVNGLPTGKNTRLKAGDLVEAPEPKEQPLLPQPEDIPLDILFEDEHLLVLNKPKHLVVHPADGNLEGTVVNALLAHCGPLPCPDGDFRPGIVHRIDKDTSGLLVVAKSDLAYEGLAQQVREHSMTRCYEAVVYGGFREEEGIVDAPLGRHPKDRKRRAVLSPQDPGAREARTHYEVLGRYEGFTHLRLRLDTGRTHQIRVHMAYIHHPLAGDELYGPKKVLKQLEGQCLHARVLGFTHPASGQRLLFESPLPDYFTRFLGSLRPLD